MAIVTFNLLPLVSAKNIDGPLNSKLTKAKDVNDK